MSQTVIECIPADMPTYVMTESVKGEPKTRFDCTLNTCPAKLQPGVLRSGNTPYVWRYATICCTQEHDGDDPFYICLLYTSDAADE